MPSVRPPSGLEDSDFASIEAAVMETARGRWFLHEHERRVREAATGRILDALAGIEALIDSKNAARQRQMDRQIFAGIAGAIEERLLDLSWSLRARGVEAAVCEMIDREAARLRRSLVRHGDLEVGPAAWLNVLRPSPGDLADTDTRDPFSPPDADEPVRPGESPRFSVAPFLPETEPAAPAAPPVVNPEPLAFFDSMTARERSRFFA